MYDARNSLRPLGLAAVLLAVTVAGSMLLGCSGEGSSDPQTGGTTSPTEPSTGAAKDGTPATSATSPGGAATAAPTGAPPSSGSSGSSDPGTDGGAAPGHDSGTTTGKPLGATCAQNSDCQSAECFMGGMGSYCSLLCTTANAATVCVAPFAGVCNNKGYCKK